MFAISPASPALTHIIVSPAASQIIDILLEHNVYQYLDTTNLIKQKQPNAPTIALYVTQLTTATNVTPIMFLITHFTSILHNSGAFPALMIAKPAMVMVGAHPAMPLTLES